MIDIDMAVVLTRDVGFLSKGTMGVVDEIIEPRIGCQVSFQVPVMMDGKVYDVRTARVLLPFDCMEPVR